MNILLTCTHISGIPDSEATDIKHDKNLNPKSENQETIADDVSNEKG